MRRRIVFSVAVLVTALAPAGWATPAHAVSAAGADGGDVSGGAGGTGSNDSLVLGNANTTVSGDEQAVASDDEISADEAWEDYLDQLNEVELAAAEGEEF